MPPVSGTLGRQMRGGIGRFWDLLLRPVTRASQPVLSALGVGEPRFSHSIYRSHRLEARVTGCDLALSPPPRADHNPATARYTSHGGAATMKVLLVHPSSLLYSEV